jgi:hypothetical protein
MFIRKQSKQRNAANRRPFDEVLGVRRLAAAFDA